MKEKINELIRKGNQWLVKQQRADGSWSGEVELNPGPSAQIVMLFHALGRNFPDSLTSKVKNYILRTQNPDGGWSTHWGSCSDVSVSLECYVALRLLGQKPENEICSRTLSFIHRAGGTAKANAWTQLYLGVLGIVPWKFIQRMPLEILFLPSWFPFHIDHMAYWVKTITLPMTLLGAVGPGKPIPLAKRLSDELKTQNLPSLSFSSKIIQKSAEFPIPGLRAHAKARALEIINSFTESHGDFGGNSCTAMNVLLALDRMGLSHEPRFQKGLDALMGYGIETENEWRMQTCQSHVWDTSFALLGLAPFSSPDVIPSIQKGCDWLLKRQVTTVSGAWSKNVSAPPGGWPFGDRHEHFPVTDCTANALIALQRHLPDFKKSKEAQLAVNWICGMQSRSGGWSAYEKYDPKWNGILEKFIQFKDIPDALIDTPKADVTAKVIQALNHWKNENSNLNENLKLARRYLLNARNPNQIWKGNYGINYLYGTSFSVQALRQLDGFPNPEWANPAQEFFLSRQNQDGGWGESEQSYQNPNAIGTEASSPVQTAWGLIGLCACYDRTEKIQKAIISGVDYLAGKQTLEGKWEENRFLGTVFAGKVYFRYEYYPAYFPLIALQAAKACV